MCSTTCYLLPITYYLPLGRYLSSPPTLPTPPGTHNKHAPFFFFWLCAHVKLVPAMPDTVQRLASLLGVLAPTPTYVVGWGQISN